MTQAIDIDVSAFPALDGEYKVTPALAAGLRNDGHVLLRGVCNAEEIAAYRPAISGAADKFNTEKRPIDQRDDTYSKAFLQITNLWERDAAVKRFTMAHRFAKIAADLLGVDGVRIYHDQALFKEPGGGPTPWHQDQYYWPLDTDETITMWMPLVDIPAEVGSITFGSGSHELGYLGELAISDESERIFNELIAEKGLHLTNYGAMTAGDATWHKGWTLHGAPGNSTGLLREVMTIIYYADGARVIDPGNNPHRQNDIDHWLTGLKAGDVAATHLNPLVYRR